MWDQICPIFTPQILPALDFLLISYEICEAMQFMLITLVIMLYIILKKLQKLLKFALVGPCLGKKKASRGHTQHQVDNFYANITKREN